MGSWFCDRLRLNFSAFAWRGIYMTAVLVKKWLIPRLISGNLAIWTVLALEKVVLCCFWVPWEINLRFCSKTQWQMFLLVSGRHVGAHGHQHGVSIQSSVNLGNTSANSARMKTSRDLILEEVVYIAIIYHIPDSWINLSNDFDFWFWSHDWWKPRITHFSILTMFGTNADISKW